MTIIINNLADLGILIKTVERHTMANGTRNEELDAKYRHNKSLAEAQALIADVLPLMNKIEDAQKAALDLVYDSELEDAYITLADKVRPAMEWFVKE